MESFSKPNPLIPNPNPLLRPSGNTSVNKRTPIADVIKNQFDALPLIQLLGQNISRRSVTESESNSNGKLWTITLENGEKYYTFSKVIGDQLKLSEEALIKGEIIEATINKVKNYYTLS